MTSAALPEPQPSISEAEPPRARRPLLLSVLLTSIGVAELVATYLLALPRLPAQFPDHFGVNGQVNGVASPAVFFGVELLTLVAAGTLFGVMQAWIGRSVPLAAIHRGGLGPPLLLIQGSLVLVVIPVGALLLLGDAAGWFGLPYLDVAELSGISALGPTITVLLLLRYRYYTPVPHRPPSTAPTARPFAAVGGPVELQCSACGQRYQLSGVPLFAPHLGLAGSGSLYLRCPRCGERGWNRLVARLGRPA